MSIYSQKHIKTPKNSQNKAKIKALQIIRHLFYYADRCGTPAEIPFFTRFNIENVENDADNIAGRKHKNIDFSILHQKVNKICKTT